MRAGKYDIKKLQNERMNEFIKASIVLSLKKTTVIPVIGGLTYRRGNRRFHGRRRHLGSGANTAKFTVNVREKS